jgi:hypothetical protein
VRSKISAKIFSEARETRGNYQELRNNQKQNNQLTRTTNAAITDAAYQVALATKAIWVEEETHSRKKSEYNPTPELEYQTQFILPCIVTTAKLYSCNFDPKDVDPARGEIQLDKVTLEEIPFAVYEYPLPKHLQPVPIDIVKSLSSKSFELLTFMDIFVVNSLYFKKLLVDQIPLKDLWGLT